ncbi:MAG: thioredoxin family protein [Pseudomonadota bacterium]
MSTASTFRDMAGETALNERLATEPAAVILFTAPDCGVCTVLRPRLEAMLDDFPRVARLQVDCAALPELARAWGVGALPTLVVTFEGRESVRFSRSFAVGQVAEALARPYELLFE